MTETRRILVVARWPVGGIRTYFRYIYSDEVFANYHFTFVLPSEFCSEALLGDALEGERYTLVKGGPSTKSLFVEAYKSLQSRKYDLIHTHGFTAGVLSVFLQKRFKTSNLLTTHDVFNERDFLGLKGRLKKNLMGLVLAGTTRIMPVGQDASENLLKFFPSVYDKTTPIRNGIPTRQFNLREARNLKAELNLSGDSFLVGFFGRFMAQKGFRYLVDAIEILSKDFNPTQVRVACFGWGGFIREEQENIRCRDLEEYFSFFPQTDDMPAAIKGANLVAMPSIWEACPLLPMEVLSCGVPIVGTSCVGSMEVFRGTPAHVIEPKDSKAIADVIKNEMSASTKARFQDYASVAVETFSSSISAKKLELLYRELF